MKIGVASDLHFNVLGDQASINSKLGWDSSAKRFTFDAGASLEINNNWKLNASYSLDAQGASTAHVGVTFTFQN